MARDYQPNARKKKWVEQLLTKREAIERAVGMPLGNMLGCGHWGCVFESTPPWVVKLSIDPTEGPIWSKIAGLVRDEVWGTQGLVEIKSIHRITPDLVVGGRKRKVWAIVREGIEPVYEAIRGRLEPTARTRTALEGPNAELFEQGIEGLRHYREAASAYHTFAPTRRRSYHLTRERSFYEYKGVGSQERAVDRIERVVQHYFYGPKMAPIGESLHMLATHGIYLRDVHLLNIGWHIARDDDDWDRVVIFDPGHTPTASVGGIEEHLIENRVVYHGTPMVFPIGEAQIGDGNFGPGFYFTSVRSTAERYSKMLATTGSVFGCDVELTNPIRYYDLFPEDAYAETDPRGFRKFSESEKELRALVSGSVALSVEDRILRLQEHGFDGILVDFRDRVRAPKDEQYYVVFDPTVLHCEQQIIGREAL